MKGLSQIQKATTASMYGRMQLMMTRGIASNNTFGRAQKQQMNAG
jgi:hypothetical protein